jgi:hypothetical protein
MGCLSLDLLVHACEDDPTGPCALATHLRQPEESPEHRGVQRVKGAAGEVRGGLTSWSTRGAV